MVLYFYARVAQRLLRLPAEQFFMGSSPIPRFLFKMRKLKIKIFVKTLLQIKEI